MKKRPAPGDRTQWGWEVKLREEWAEVVRYAAMRWGL